MLYDRRDFGLLRLAGTYQWLPLAPLQALSSLKLNETERAARCMIFRWRMGRWWVRRLLALNRKRFWRCRIKADCLTGNRE